MSSKQKQHIKVFARVRPRNAQEVRSNLVVDCVSQKEVAVKDKGQTKLFTFDRVFGAESKQVDVYKAVVSPRIPEVLQGYNCTVFAYGQTGTGKTFTMVGEKSQGHVGGWENDPLSGIVPRALDHLFDELKILRADDYTVLVSFLELYNEELCDLLATGDSDDSKALKLFDDSMKKGSVIVQNLVQRAVYNKNDVYPILEAGSLRRQTAATLMNASSSRSHTIFTITVHVKVTTPDGEDLYKNGKLNLVDLAGSENIGRSGAVEMRAREAGNINMSLLTLGRVITALVERTPHVPYRESKLTRLLQDSLGGRTMTSIIATVSPAQCNLEETLSTFDYAHRARNITNKPEINQKMSKSVALKEYNDKIEKLTRELQAAREKHGVYLPAEEYEGMQAQIEHLNEEHVIKVQLLRMKDTELECAMENNQRLQSDLEESRRQREEQEAILKKKDQALRIQNKACLELKEQSEVILSTADEVVDDNKRLHDRLDRTRMINKHNQEFLDNFIADFIAKLNNKKKDTEAHNEDHGQLVDDLKNRLAQYSSESKAFLESHLESEQKFISNLEEVEQKWTNQLVALIAKEPLELEKMTKNLEETRENLEKNVTNLGIKIVMQEKAREPVWRSIHQQLGNVEQGLQMDLVNGMDGAQKTICELADSVNRIVSDPDEAVKEREKRIEVLEAQLINVASNNENLYEEIDHVGSELVRLQNQLNNLNAALRNNSTLLVKTTHELEEERRCLEEERKKAADQAKTKVESLKTEINARRSAAVNIQQMTQTVIPRISAASAQDLVMVKSHQEKVENYVGTTATELKQIAKDQNDLSLRLSVTIDNGNNFAIEQTAMMKTYDDEFRAALEREGERVDRHFETTQAAYRVIDGRTCEFCERTFAHIHDRCIELKDFLKGDILVDEKTGTTPQRKEFQYPRRLVTPPRISVGPTIVDSFTEMNGNGSVNDSKQNLSNGSIKDC